MFSKALIPISASPESNYTRATQELDHALATGGFESLQTYYCVSSGTVAASMWRLVGIAARICLELGLHRESARSRTVPVRRIARRRF